MESFFVPSLDSDDPDVISKNWTARTAHWKEIVRKQFQLSYLGDISYDTTDNMSIHEMNTLYGLLVDQKRKEAEVTT